mgnify:CR=1 FL=1
MLIRKMQIADYPAVFALWQSCSGMGLNNLDDSREGITRFLERNPDTCFVAEAEQQILGAILTGNDGRRGYIYHTAVSPQQQKQGIGTLLVQAALEALRKNGIHKVALVVFAHNIGGNVFWEKRGFTVREDLIYRNLALTEMVRFDTE